ncbi:hypothetical protein EGT07_02225 [Herbaspirillum sp. HC18]|nr:hypothetical protein EGT07_02225 [Herbaspirillum sp. HC18]
MKKISVFVALASLTLIAGAGEKTNEQLPKEAADHSLASAKPIKEMTTFFDSKGCLWGRDAKNAKFKIYEQSGKQYCQPMK